MFLPPPSSFVRTVVHTYIPVHIACNDEMVTARLMVYVVIHVGALLALG